MCDSVAVVPDEGAVWFAKNSDREPSEAQFVECHDGAGAKSPRGLPSATGSARTLLSRPAWMWGCEMGVNAYGLAIGNQSVFTRLPVKKAGHTGMDFQRLALASCRTADDAIQQLIELTERVPQGGAMGHRNRSFRYHSSFIVADPTAAWVFETAGRFWAAKRVRGVATISNALTIEDDFDRIHRQAFSYARKRRWVKNANDFSFASAFSDPIISFLAGADARRACTARTLSGLRSPRPRDFIRALTDHGSVEPGHGLRSEAPCAHASWLPTRTSAQTTSSLVARLDASGPTVWATGTSSPCLSVFKPAPFDPVLFPPRPIADARFDSRELWWVHERLHRDCLRDYHARRVTFAADLERFQDRCLEPNANPATAWREHRVYVDEWRQRARKVKAPRTPLLERRFWTRQARELSIPG